MSRLVQFSLLGLLVAFAVGCNGGGTAKGPSEDEAAKLNARMESDMKSMMQQVPKKPK